MKHTAIILALGAGLVWAASLAAQKETPQKEREFPIKISIVDQRWVTVVALGPATIVALVEMNYDKGCYAEKKVHVVAEISISDKDSEEIKHCRQPMEEVEIGETKGTIFGSFGMPDVTLEGVVALEFYLEDPGGKVLSKRISNPVAAGEKAEKELTAKLAPARLEPPKKRA